MNWLQTLAQEPFFEFAVILFLAAVLGGLGQLLRQPLIVMFIALGIIVGPSVLDVVQSKENIHLLAEVGIAILLFIVGLKLDLRLIKSTGKIALMTGLGQVFFTSAIGYLIGIALGFHSLHSFYIAVALTFSSTIIIVKLLSDKREIDALHGQIAIGFLIVQDMVVILVMIILSTLGNQTANSSITTEMLKTALSIAGLLVLTWLLMRWVIPRLSFFLAKSQELLTLFAIAMAVALAAFSDYIGFSPEVGAFLAGISLASSPFKDVISSRLVSLRDFLLLFFFVNLGANLNIAIIGNQMWTAFLFSIFVLIGNPIIVLIIMGTMGYRKRTGFLAGLTVAQISEFSLIFAGLGLQVGHINEETVGLITLVGLITIGLSTYMILYSFPIYERIAPLLSIFERKDPQQEARIKLKEKQQYDVVLFGLGRFGSQIVQNLEQHPDISYVGVDFDPQVVKQWQNQGKSVIYGDIDDPDILEHIPYENARIILSTVPDSQYSMQLIQRLRRNNYRGKVYLTALQDQDMELLLACRADQILMPYHMAAENFYSKFIEEPIEKAK